MSDNVLDLVENAQTSEFYPTPPALVQKMLDGIDWDIIDTILEPSAGKGDIIREIAIKENSYCRYNHLRIKTSCRPHTVKRGTLI